MSGNKIEIPKKNSVKKNYLYNLSYQILLLFFPLITIPYAARILGAEGIGTFAFTNSIVQYFVLFANLGISTYALREIAKVKNRINLMNDVFNDILSFQILTSFVISVCFLIYVLIFHFNDRILYLIQIISILSVGIDISWLYIGIEDFRKNAIRNVLIKVSIFFLLFIVVKTKKDLINYILLINVSSFVGQLFMWVGIKRYIKTIKINFANFSTHLKGCMKLFYILLIGIVGTNINKTLIGIFVNQSEVGKYDMAFKIIMLILVISTSLGAVLLTRVANSHYEGDIEGVKTYINFSFNFISFFGFGMCFGLLGLSHQITSILFGPNFIDTSTYLMIMAPIILLNSWSNIFSTQFMIPTNNEKKYIKSLIIGIIVGIGSSFLLIPRFSAKGACYSFLIGEIVILTSHLIQIKNLLPLRMMVMGIWKYLVSALILLIYILLINSIELPFYLKVGIQIIGGSLLYILLALFIFNTLAKEYLNNLIINKFPFLAKLLVS